MLHWQVCYPRCCMSQRSSWPHGSKGFLRVAWPSQKNHNTPGLLPMMQLPKHAMPAEMPAVRSIMLAGGQHTCLLSCRNSTGAISEAGLLIHAPCLGYQLGVLAGHLPVRERDLVTSEASALYIARLSCTGLQQACTRACTTCVMTLHSESCSCSMVHVVPALLTCIAYTPTLTMLHIMSSAMLLSCRLQLAQWGLEGWPAGSHQSRQNPTWPHLCATACCWEALCPVWCSCDDWAQRPGQTWYLTQLPCLCALQRCGGLYLDSNLQPPALKALRLG